MLTLHHLPSQRTITINIAIRLRAITILITNNSSTRNNSIQRVFNSSFISLKLEVLLHTVVGVEDSSEKALSLND